MRSISPPVFRSRLTDGSTARSTLGWEIRARAIACPLTNTAAGQLARAMLDAVREPDGGEQLGGRGDMPPALPPIAPGALSDHQRRKDVFLHLQLGEQVIELKNHAVLLIAQRFAGLAGQVVDPSLLRNAPHRRRGRRECRAGARGVLLPEPLWPTIATSSRLGRPKNRPLAAPGFRPALCDSSFSSRGPPCAAGRSDRKRAGSRTMTTRSFPVPCVAARAVPTGRAVGTIRFCNLLITQCLHWVQSRGAHRRQNAGQHGNHQCAPARSSQR